MKITKIKPKKFLVNIGELHKPVDHGFINPEIEFVDENGDTVKSKMRLHVTEELDGLIFADPRKFPDNGYLINSTGSAVIARKKDYTDKLPESIILNENLLGDVQLFQVHKKTLIEALNNNYDFESERKNYISNTKENLEIAFTCHDPNIIGGGNVILFRIINWLSSLGLKVTVYSCGSPPSWILVNAKFKCYKTYKEMFADINEPVVIVYSMWHIESIMKANPKGKLVYHIRQIYEPFHYGADYESMIARKPAIELLETLPIGVITISPHLEDYYKKHHELTSHLITNGIDPKVFFPTKEKTHKQNTFTIVSVGNPNHFVKGSQVLFKSLKLLAERRREIKFIWNILSGGKGNVDYPDIPKNLMIEQKVGLSQLQMREEYSDADLFVNSSLYEGFGLPPLEAMMTGTPVVQADNLGLDFIVDGKEDCLLVPVNDELKTADAIEKLFNDWELYKKLADGGFRKAMLYTTRHQFNMFLKEFEVILNTKFDESKIANIEDSFGYEIKEISSLKEEISNDKKFNPLVSIILPSYNQAEYLKEALDSILAQTYSNWEAIVVNDGSTDNTEEVMNEYASRDSRIRPLSKPNGGITSALNAGVNQAKGQFFCWLSSDDLFYPDKLLLQVDEFEKLDESYALVYGSFDILQNETKELTKQPMAEPVIAGCEFPEALKFDFIDGCTIMIRMNVMREVKAFNPNIVHSQDMELWVRLASRGYKFKLLPHKLTIRRVHYAQSSSTNMIHCRYDALWIMNFYIKHYHLLEMYRYINFNSEQGIKDFVKHFVGRTLNTEANVNNPLLMDNFWNWFEEGIKALPLSTQNTILRNCLIEFINYNSVSAKIRFYIDKCLKALNKPLVCIPIHYDYSAKGRDFREADRFSDELGKRLFDYGTDLLVNSNTPVFAHELYFHGTNKFVDTPYKLGHSALRYLTQFNTPYKKNIQPYGKIEDIPQNEEEALIQFCKIKFGEYSESFIASYKYLCGKGNSVEHAVDSDKVIASITGDLREDLQQVCLRKPTVPILYYWNALVLEREGKTKDALNEAWKIFGINNKIFDDRILLKIRNIAEKVKDWEKAFIVNSIAIGINKNAQQFGKIQDELRNKFISFSNILPKRAKSIETYDTANYKIAKIVDSNLTPLVDGSFVFEAVCMDENANQFNVYGKLPYTEIMQPMFVKNSNNNEDYLILPDKIFEHWLGNYNFIRAMEYQLRILSSNEKKISVAFSIPNATVMSGGAIIAYRFIEWLKKLNVEVSVYTNDGKPKWINLDVPFYINQNEISRIKSIKEDVVIIFTAVELQRALKYIPDDKRVFHLAQVVEDFHYHGGDYTSLNKPKGIFEILHSLPVGRISISKHIHKYIKNVYNQSSFLIENGINIKNFTPKVFKPFDNEITIMTVGNPERLVKGIQDVKDALTILADKRKDLKLKLIVVSGHKPNTDAIIKGGDGYNLTTLWGLTQEDMADLYSKIDIYVNSSWYEGFGLPSLEAMASGVPLLQVDNKGLDGIVIDGKNCLMVKPDNPNDLALKIEQLIDNEKLHKDLVQNGLGTLKSYTLVNQFEQFVKTFEQILFCKFNEGEVERIKQEYQVGEFEDQLKVATELIHPKISIIIPTSGEPGKLERTINSLQSQIYSNWEAVIVYSGNWKAKRKVKNYSLIDSRIKTFGHSSDNYAGMLNLGINKSTGEWLIVMPAGTYYTNSRLLDVIHAWEMNPDKKLFYTDYYVDNGDGKEPELPNKDWILNIPVKEFQLIGLFNYNYIYPQSLFIHRSVFYKTGYFDENYGPATTYQYLLRVLKSFDSTFMQVGGCAGDLILSPETLPGNSEVMQDFKRVVVDFVTNANFEDLFPLTDFSDSRNIIELSLAFLTVLKKKTSLVNLLNISDVLDSKFDGWVNKLNDAGIKNRILQLKENFSSQVEFQKSRFNNKYKNGDLNFISVNKTSKNTDNKKSESEEDELVSIIIPSYNNAEYLDNCINSILKYTKADFELIIVDNASDEDTKKIIEGYSKKYKQIKPIYNESNLGFPVAVNQGLKNANGNYIVVANNDIIVTEGWLERMTQLTKADRKYGIVGPISNIVSGVQLDKDAKYSSMEDMHKYAAEVKIKNKGKFEEFPRVAFLCTLIKKEVVDKIGGLDERFSPGNFEDDDFCLRTELAGYKTMIAEDVFIHHFGSKSFRANGEDAYAKRLEHNKQLFISKWGADPEEIWLKSKSFTNRNPLFPLHKDRFVESMQRAMILMDEKDFTTALLYLDNAIDSYDASERVGYENLYLADVLNLAGNACVMVDDFEKAHTYFEKELQLNPTSSRACAGLAEVFLNAEMFDEAKTMFEWSLKYDNSNNSSLTGLKKVNLILQLAEEHNTLENES